MTSDYAYVANAIEKKNITKLLDSDRRLDGRSKNDFREIKIEKDVVGTANGSAIVHLGKTKVICGVKAVIGTPFSDYPNKGSIFVGFETSPLSAPEYRLGPPQPDAIEIARMTDRAIRESDCVDLDDLCLIENEKVWTLNIDLYALDDNGNLYDACVIAAYVALSLTKIPETKIDGDGEVEILETLRPIKINSFPISVTTYKIDNHLITDADLKEEQMSDARISFGTTETHIVSGQKGGNGAFKSNQVIEILKNSINTAAKMREIIKSQL